MIPVPVLVDANVLVKDVVSCVLFDLAKAGLIDLRWTPQIEAEYVRNRARMRAKVNDRELALEDWMWTYKRLQAVKAHLVPDYLPPTWDADGRRLDTLRNDADFAPLLRLPDAGDVHVALAAADWARSAGQSLVLATDNLKDFPARAMVPFGVYPLHPGDVLDLMDRADPEGLSISLQKTTADFKRPAFTLADMLVSVRSPQQFDNKVLAAKLQARWGLASSVKHPHTKR